MQTSQFSHIFANKLEQNSTK